MLVVCGVLDFRYAFYELNVGLKMNYLYKQIII